MPAVKTFLTNEKVAIQRIMDGARKKIGLEKRARETVEAELEAEKKRSDMLYEELTKMRANCAGDALVQYHVPQEGLDGAMEEAAKLRKVLMRQQVRALFHILNNIEMQRMMHFFSKWRQWTNDQQTLAAAEDLRRMTDVTSPQRI